MVEEEYSISIEDLQKKFQKWFGKPVPADPPHPVDIEHSMGRPVPVDLSAIVSDLDHEACHIHGNNPQKLPELLYLGFMGAVTSGAVVGFIIFILDFGFPGWHSGTGLSPFIVIFFALLLGFYIGLSKGYITQQREKYFYKDEFYNTHG